jgi:adenylosuccinate synthase
MARSESKFTTQCNLCDICCKSEQEFIIHRQKCLINQVMDIKYLESSIPSSLNYENTDLITELVNQNITDQRKVIDEQTEAIEKQKNDIVDQTAEIAEQRTQILAMIAQTESKNDTTQYFCWSWEY